MRIALLTYEALAAAEAVRRFTAAHASRIALVGLSQVYRPGEGDPWCQTRKHLGRSGWRILPYLAANFTLPALAPRPAGTGPNLERTPLRRTCERLGLPVADVDDVNGEAFRKALADSGAELIVTYHFDQILTAGTIAAAPMGGINVHAALLPRHRGPAPTIHALMDEEPRFGVTIHRLAPEIDAGPILAQAGLDLPATTTAVEAARRLHAAAEPLLAQVIDELAAGRAQERAFAPGPYCGWPSATALQDLARRGRRLAGLADCLRALRIPT